MVTIWYYNSSMYKSVNRIGYSPCHCDLCLLVAYWIDNWWHELSIIVQKTDHRRPDFSIATAQN